MKNSTVLKSVLFFFLLSVNWLNAQTTAIPDVVFEETLIDLGLDSGAPDGFVLTVNIDTVSTLDVRGPEDLGGDISDLSGIEDFKALTYLNCGNNKITSLDISDNKNLIELYCYGNQLEELDVSKNEELEILDCGNNQIKTLLLDLNLKLTDLDCSYNKLSSLDIEQNTKLLQVFCGTNELTNLNLLSNNLLQVLGCSSNQLTFLDASGNIALLMLYCDFNQLSEIDVSKNTALEYLGCNFNELSNLDLSNNVNLLYLYCLENQLKELDLSKNTALRGLYCWKNQLAQLDLSKQVVLEDLYCSDNLLFCLNIRNGNNHNMLNFSAKNNPNLFCIEVDDPAFSTSKWTLVDAGTSFQADCTISCSVGLKNTKEEWEKIKVFPNPNNGRFSIDLGPKREKGRVVLFNNVGQKVSTLPFEGTGLLAIDFKASKGIYFLQLETLSGQSKVAKLVVE